MTLLNEIKTNQKLKKIFGERELKIIEKQLLGVKLKPSETVRLSRDIRKKFEAIKEISKYAENFELKKAIEIKRIINETLEIIRETKYFTRIKKIILFGSAVENKLALNSDIDISVEFSEIGKLDAGEFRKFVLGRVNKRVDIQVYNFLPKKIKNEIDKKGKVLFETKK